MHRAFAMAVAAISLAGCSSFSTDYFKSTPPTVQVQLESTPPGADARTSIGPGCKTPCSVSVTPPETGFTVNYALPGTQGATVPVQVVKESGGTFSADTFKVSPNPVFAELHPTAPPPKAHKVMHPKRKKPADTAAAPASAAPAAAAAPDSAFPNPGAAAPPQR